MYRTFNFQIISEQCPNDKVVCPVQEYLGNQQSLRQTVNESLYAPAKPIANIDEIANILNNMYTICANCKKSR